MTTIQTGSVFFERAIGARIGAENITGINTGESPGLQLGDSCQG
jgi:hypothetical protein